MTLRQPNLERMLQLGLSGMAEALEEQHDIADIGQLDFDDRLAMLLEREVSHRDRKSYLGYLRQAQLRIRADIQDVDCRAGRGIARTTLVQLAAGDWIRQGVNLIVEGATGSGKTFIACALAHQACRQKRPVLYRRVSELVSALARARDRGTHERLMRRLAKVSLLAHRTQGRVPAQAQQAAAVERRLRLRERLPCRAALHRSGSVLWNCGRALRASPRPSGRVDKPWTRLAPRPPR